MLTTEAADQLAVLAHGDDRSKSGDLFIDHVRRVAAAVEGDPDPYAVTAALLHDAVEKGAIDWTRLRSAGADDRLVELVDALTERRGETVHAYLARCAADPVALRVKRADILDKIVNRSGHLDEARRAKREAKSRRRLKLLEQLAAEATTA